MPRRTELLIGSQTRKVLECHSYLTIIIRRDNASVPLYVVNEDNNEEVERARKKAEKEEREDRNMFVGFNYVEILLWLVKNNNYDAQEMERDEGEGVKGCVWAKGKEEGGQGHEEQDDGQGVEVPELQVGTDKEMCHQMLRLSNFRDNLDAEIWECQNGHGFCGDCFDKDNAGRGEGELEMGEDGIFR